MDKSRAAIWGIGTAVPPYRMEQEDTSRRLADALLQAGQSDSSRWAKKIFRQCGVQTRYTCEPNLLQHAEECRYFPSGERTESDMPATSDRMALYKRASVPLAAEAAAKAMADGRVDAADITHLITVSCTGQFLPGLDAALIRELGLKPSVERYPLTFLGCAAGVRGMSLAKRLVEGRSKTRALIVCAELCTLHIQPSAGREALYGASFFGDGASACVIGEAAGSGRGTDSFVLGEDLTATLPDSEGEMTWEVGNYGFDLHLSPSIPRLIGEHVPAAAARLTGDSPNPELWAIHPGGRGIVDALQETFGLSDKQTSASRTVLRDYGNMSSATILFVLQEMRRMLRLENRPTGEGIIMAFGPGVTAELIRMTYSPTDGSVASDRLHRIPSAADAYA